MAHQFLFKTTLLMLLTAGIQTTAQAQESTKLAPANPAGQANPAKPILAPVLPTPQVLAEEPISTESVPSTQVWDEPGILGLPNSYGVNGYPFWASAETLLWAVKAGHTPALATNGTLASGGALVPGATTLFGGNMDYQTRVGGRFGMGYWFDPEQTIGIEGNYFFLGGPSNNYSTNSAGNPGSMILARPFTNAINGLPSSQIISFPGITSGGIGISSNTFFQGAQLNGIYNLINSGGGGGMGKAGYGAGYGQGNSYNSGFRMDAIGGFMYLNLNESLDIHENLLVLPSAPAPFVSGSSIRSNDHFGTSNNFYGGQIGGRAEVYSGGWFSNVTSTIAFGNTHQEVRINGSTTFASPNTATVTQRGGVFALPTNIGTYSRDQFGVVPQVGFNVGRQLTDNMRVFVGYTFIYWSNVVRPGDQVDPVINPTQLPTRNGPGTLVGPARPAFAFHDTDFWAQGMSFGLEFRR